MLNIGTFVKKRAVNYLAHIFLSGKSRKLQVGNFIGDFVKGSSYLEYPQTIAEGIVLHRRIDTYTDQHPIVRESIELLRPHFNRYTPIITDIYFDYLLASQFELYNPKVGLKRFAYNFYLSALLNYRHLPPQVKEFIFHFISTNRLMEYSHYPGLLKTFQIIHHVKIEAIEPEKTVEALQENEEQLRLLFNQFMPQLISYVESITPTLAEKL